MLVIPPLPPLPPLPTLQQIEDYIYTLEDYVVHQLPPNLSQTVQRIFDDLRRFGPPVLPDFGLGELQGRLGTYVEIPIPPPPPPKTSFQVAADWVASHKLIVLVASLATAGVVGYVVVNLKDGEGRRFRKIASKRRDKGVARVLGRNQDNSVKRDVVVILGADATPYGPAVVKSLEEQGHIVIASVSSPDAVYEIEKAGKGWVRALVLDPTEVDSTSIFLRSLSSTLSLRFPTTLAGDPYISNSSNPLSAPPALTSLISLLSLTPTAQLPESISSLGSSQAFLPNLVRAQITPLSIVTSILPLFRSRNRDIKYSKSVILCVPATARVGLAGHGEEAMLAAGLVKGAEVLRRELAQDEDLGDVKVVVVDVGEISAEDDQGRKQDEGYYWAGRKPSNAKVLGEALGTVVRGRFEGEGWAKWAAWWIGGWWRGQRFSVGAGAYTYTLASHLPTRFLDTLLAIPHRLTSLHAYIYGQPIVPATPRPPAHTRLSSSTTTALASTANKPSSASRSIVLPTTVERERGEGVEESGTIRSRPRKSVSSTVGSPGIANTGALSSANLNAVNTPDTPTPTLGAPQPQSTPTASTSGIGRKRQDEREPGSPLSSPEEDYDDLYPSQPQSEFDFSSEGEGTGPETGSRTRSARSGNTTESWVDVSDT
ncbi:hypothetical protein BOTBODRAFT_52866 [Botryobasidium botryosum FD-172 SS1]|uniref:DUF1776-domain-containing protein n=1 Tax=Botryobasidium botryosum (strain FD-172 SS1) TaxID=930990 RepID=A0A067MTM3_BOTB1|nr:hypothetical protein BOTBODRAFT_52866 [Botryobasidium botryosum FD-172 SS1]